MIEFLQDYTTKALPPEVFKNEERVERSAESELYFVRLGLAAYVTADGLVDVDYRPIERVVVTAIERVDPRSLPAGRAGEIPVTVEAPPPASAGPGNVAMFGGDQQTVAVAAAADAAVEQAEAVADDGETASPKPGKRTVTPAASA